MAPLHPRRKLATAGLLGFAIAISVACTGLVLQALGVFPPGDSPGKTKLALLFFALAIISLSLCAVARKDLPRSKDAPVVGWVGWFVLIIMALAITSAAVVRTLKTIR